MSTSTAPRDFTGQHRPCESPTLLLLQASSRPKTLCTLCPLADWFDQDDLHCYCMQRHVLTFGKRAKNATPVYACDAREVAITEEKEKEKAKAKAAAGASA